VHSLSSTFDAPVALSEQASLVEVSPSTVIRLNDCANWGRILAAVGRSNITHLKADEVNIYLGEVCIVSRGELDERYTEAAVHLRHL
jgi:hypothetical protein